MILIVNGPCGVGKSTVTRELEKHFTDCAHIKADDVHCFIVNSQISPEHIRLTDLNICSLVKNFKENNMDNIIIDNVYETTSHINQVIEQLKKYDPEVYHILLYCDLEENIRRDSRRAEDDICGEQRVRELHDIMYKQEGLGKLFDNTSKTKEIVANEIVEYIRETKGGVK